MHFFSKKSCQSIDTSKKCVIFASKTLMNHLKLTIMTRLTRKMMLEQIAQDVVATSERKKIAIEDALKRCDYETIEKYYNYYLKNRMDAYWCLSMASRHIFKKV